MSELRIEFFKKDLSQKMIDRWFLQFVLGLYAKNAHTRKKLGLNKDHFCTFFVNLTVLWIEIWCRLLSRYLRKSVHMETRKCILLDWRSSFLLHLKRIKEWKRKDLWVLAFYHECALKYEKNAPLMEATINSFW